MESEILNACKDFNLEKVALLCQDGAPCEELFQHFAHMYTINWTFWDDRNLAHREHKFRQVFQLLLNSGLDVNILDTQGKTALHYCCGSGWQVDIMKMLLSAGADINIAAANSGLYPLHFTLLDPNSPGLRAVQRQAKLRHFNKLVELGADVNVLSTGMNTPLMTFLHQDNDIEMGCYNTFHVKYKDQLSVISTLIANGADLNHCNRKHQTVLHCLIMGHPTIDTDNQIFNLIVNEYPNPSLQDRNGNTPLHVLCTNMSCIRCIRYEPYLKGWCKCLLEAGARVNIRNSENHLPFRSLLVKILDFQFKNQFARGVKLWVYDFLQILHLFLEAGLNLSFLDSTEMESLDLYLVKGGGYSDIMKAVFCGYKLSIEAMNLGQWEWVEQKDLTNYCFNALPLKRLAANVIRISLRPNAIVGMKVLNLPKALEALVFVN